MNWNAFCVPGGMGSRNEKEVCFGIDRRRGRECMYKDVWKKFGKYAFQAFRHSRLAFHTRPSSGTALQAAAFVYVLNALLQKHSERGTLETRIFLYLAWHTAFGMMPVPENGWRPIRLVPVRDRCFANCGA